MDGPDWAGESAPHHGDLVFGSRTPTPQAKLVARFLFHLEAHLFFAEESTPGGTSTPRAGIPPFKKREEKSKLTRAGIAPVSFPARGGGIFVCLCAVNHVSRASAKVFFGLFLAQNPFF